jgi:hypothetical protein
MEREADLAHHHLWASALGGDAKVEARRDLSRPTSSSEERVASVRAGRREDLE